MCPKKVVFWYAFSTCYFVSGLLVLKNILATLKKFGSNIIFSNGLLDPWSGGRWYITYSSNIFAMMFNMLTASDNSRQLMSDSDIQIISVAVFCRIYLKVLFLLLLKKVMHLIILNLLVFCCCMDPMLKQLFAHSYSTFNESIFLSKFFIISLYVTLL